LHDIRPMFRYDAALGIYNLNSNYPILKNTTDVSF